MTTPRDAESVPPRTPPGTGSDNPDALGEVFLSTSRRLRHHIARSLAPTGMVPHHARALRIVDRDGPMRLGELAAALHVVPRSVTDVVDALADAGWVTRTPDPVDRRATVITTTPAGRARAREVEQVRRAAGDDFFASLPAADRATLRHILQALGEEA
ncbi:MarR family winged helix-turn-helix transcriptional regulator [Kytococcus sedentarius]|uniref:MarR family winged helix-turn-helix transcriptional regulator n=1 Tax=Kytococcus sedentarius TaxID=1276 RepID=UPI0019504A47|nr:MarR family transcriptional regulator [Kytococcus sedentarius]QRO87490.1 MarR family transcriptional regulator [Kytococcus sedentarius]